jgi:hypothetical protein
MIQVSYHKAHKWLRKGFKVVCMIYYEDGHNQVVMSK